MMKEYAYDTKLPAAYKGGNIRILDRHYGVGSRDELTKWDEHPWSTAAYIIEGFPVCGVDPAAFVTCVSSLCLFDDTADVNSGRLCVFRVTRVARAGTGAPPSLLGAFLGLFSDR